MPTISISDATEFIESSLHGIGMPDDNATQIAEVILDGELRGHPDHGLFFFLDLINWHTRDTAYPKMNVNPSTKIVLDTSLITTIDGDGACGVLPMNEAVERSIMKAKNHGMAAANVVNTANLIALAPFAQRLVEEDLIAFVCSGFQFPFVPPTGGLAGKFGTNPLAYAAPAGKHLPFLLDMSTSAIAGAKVIEAGRNGETIPEGLVEHADGTPLTDAADFKIGSSMVLPMAGVKGYGLAMMVDIFANIIGDNQWGHFIWLLDPAQFQPIEKFKANMDLEIVRIKSGDKKSDVDEIYYAGERGQKRMAELRSSGLLPLKSAAWKNMQIVSEEHGVDMPTLIGT